MLPLIIENAVPEQLFKRFVADFENTEWRFLPTAAYRSDVISYDSSFSKILLLDGTKHSDSLLLAESVLLAAMSKTNYTVTSLLRVRYGMFMKKNENYVHPAHVDMRREHLTALLYVNDSDGETFIYKEKYDLEEADKFGLEPNDYLDIKLNGKLTVDIKIKPKANTLVLFDGMTYHASSSPVETERRMAMNCNLVARMGE